MKKSFWLLVIFSEILYLSLYLVRFVYPNESFQYAFLLLLLLFVFYVKLVGVARKGNMKVWGVFLPSIVFNLTLLFLVKLPSDDIFTHIYRSRLFSKYGANPYLVPYDAYSHDLFYSALKTVWSSKTAVYGPVVTILGSILTYVAGDMLWLNIILFKAFYVFLNLCSGVLIYRITSSKVAAIVYSWNPIIVFGLSGNNHTDLIMIFFFLLSLYFLINKVGLTKHLKSWVFFIISVFSKYYTLIFAPFILVYVFKKEPKRKYSFLVLSGIMSVSVLFLVYLPFWDAAIFDRLLLLWGSDSSSKSLALYLLPKGISKILFVICYFVAFVSFLMESKKMSLEKMIYYLMIVLSMFFLTSFGLFLPWYTTLLITLVSVYIGFRESNNVINYMYVITTYSFLLYLLNEF